MQHIIIVEDDAVQLEIIEQMLSLDNYRIATFSRSRHVLEHIDNMQVDLILIDLGLPDIDGFTLCQRLRKIANLQHTPIVAFSADLSLNAQVKSNLSGFNGFIEKPFRTREFRTQITNYLNGNPVSF